MIDNNSPDFNNTPISLKRAVFNYQLQKSYTNPYVSIITPFYNAGLIFLETAQSVFNQSFQQWEWIIVNDGSTDTKSLEILNNYRYSDGRIRIIDHKVNKGLSAARNTGYKNAKSEYILQLDTDDLLEPTEIEKCFWFLESYYEYSFVKGFSVGFGAQNYLWDKGFHNTDEFLIKNLVTPTVMIRRGVFEKTRGYDETNRRGLEDWDFWLMCASEGYWGNTIPEYLDWYRRRVNHNERWSNWDDGKNEGEFLKNLRNKYSRLWKNGIPKISLNTEISEKKVFEDFGEINLLSKSKKRVLFLIPWMTLGGADKFNLDLIYELIEKDYEVSIIATLHGDNSWLPEFARFTPDIFILCNFLKFHDYPKFIKYFLKSRDIDFLIISHSELGYFILPYLRLNFSDLTIIDYCHIEEMEWNGGGYPRLSVDYQKYFDLNIVSSEHLKRWMVDNGSDPERIEVCYTNIDENLWNRDLELRENMRKELNIGKDAVVILFSGRICDQKQPDVLLKTFSRLSSQVDLDFIALIAGDGEEMARLKKNVKKMGLAKEVKLLGQLPINRIKELMSASDIYFMPSKWEGIAISIFEAMSSGLPVVGADVGGQGELVTEDCGVLIRRSTPKEESEKYAEILKHLIIERKKRVELGRNSRERICNFFNKEIMRKKIESCLDKAFFLNRNFPSAKTSAEIAYDRLVKGMTFLAIARGLPELKSHRYGISYSRTVNTSYRYKLYRSINYFYEHLYRYAKKRGWSWLFPLANKIKKIILGT